MSDLISRRKAFEYFVTLWECIGTIMDRDEWEDVCMTTANEIPSAQPEQRWIPCSERLPESYEDVLVYYEYYKYCDYGSMCFQTYGIGYCSNDGTWHGDVSGTKAKCLAWMPLPDAYEEDD